MAVRLGHSESDLAHAFFNVEAGLSEAFAKASPPSTSTSDATLGDLDGIPVAPVPERVYAAVFPALTRSDLEPTAVGPALSGCVFQQCRWHEAAWLVFPSPNEGDQGNVRPGARQCGKYLDALRLTGLGHQSGLQFVDV